MKKILSLVVLAGISALTACGAELSAALPVITYRGRFVDALSGVYPAGVERHDQAMTFRVYDTDVQGAEALWSSGRRFIPVSPDGSFEAKFGDERLAALITTGAVTHVGLLLGEQRNEITPRRALLPVASVTRAIVAEDGTPDMKIGTLEATSVAARSLTVSLAEISGSLVVEAGKIRVEPFALLNGETTRLLRGKGVKVFANGAPKVLVAARASVSANETLATAEADGVALIHCVGSGVNNIPGTIQFCRKGDAIVSPASARDVSVAFWEFAK